MDMYIASTTCCNNAVMTDDPCPTAAAAPSVLLPPLNQGPTEKLVQWLSSEYFNSIEMYAQKKPIKT